MNKIIKNHNYFLKYLKECKINYNVEDIDSSTMPQEYPCIAVSQLILDNNGVRIRFNFIYKKDCRKLLKIV